MNNLAIIPARSGSKGLPDKNILELRGKPLLAYSVEAALNSGIFSCVHVSTDSEQYAQIGRECGADIPFLRSEEMSTDTAGSWDVVLEVMNNYKKMGKTFDMVTLLQPTSPLRNAEDIIDAYQKFLKKNAKAVVSVCEVDHSPLWCNTLPEDDSLQNFIRVKEGLARQQLPLYYRVNGAIYMVDCEFLSKGTNLYRDGCYAYIMAAEKSIDIDTKLDFMIAECILNSGIL